MAKLFFMRHTKTDMNKDGLWSGRTDCNITEEGKEMARKNFNFNANDFSIYYCSPLKRTFQTLEAVIPDQEPIIDERIIERDFGDWEGKPYSIISDAETEMYIQGKIQPPNGESYQEVERRVKSFVEELFNKHENENILIVSHATILRMVRDIFLPNMEKKPIKNSQVLIVTNNEFNAYKERNKNYDE